MEVLVVEQAGWCSVALRRLLAERAVGTILQSPSTAEVLQRLSPQSTVFVVVVVHDLAAALCDVRQIYQNGVKVSLTVVVPGEVAAVWRGSPQWPIWLAAVRQAGAVDVAISLVELPRVADTIARWRTQVPSEAIGLREALWNRLPWSNSAG